MVIDMRYLLFFIVLFLHSQFVFSQGSGDSQPSSGGAPQPICTGSIKGGTYLIFLPEATATCQNVPFSSFTSVYVSGTGPYGAYYTTECKTNCACPPGSTWVQTAESSSCKEDEDPDEDCDGQPKVYDPVSGTMVCPGSGDGNSSAAASSNSCVVPGDFNGDCVPDDEQASSANNSTPTSSPDSGSAASAGGGGDDGGDDGGGGGGGGGGGDDGGGNNSGGGSASAAASSAGSGTGSNSSWTPNSGYGNWIPVDEGSNCPNKYKDANGQWWCSGNTNAPSSEGSGQCDPTAVNYWSCINSGSAGSAGSAGAASSDDSESKLSDKNDELIDGITEDIDSELSDFEDAYTDDIDAFKRDGVPFDNEPGAIKSLLISFLPVSTPCNPPSINLFGRNYELECDYFNIFKQAFGWFLAILTAYQIWQLAIRPVER